MEINKVSLDELLRIPGVGTTSALRIVRQRRMAAIQFDDLKKIGVVVKRARYFITCCGKYSGGKEIAPEYIKNEVLASEQIRNRLLPIDDNVQISMFNPIVPQIGPAYSQASTLTDGGSSQLERRSVSHG